MTSLMFWFFIVGPADRKTENYHKTIYTLENHPIVIYIGVVFVKNQTYDTFQVTAYIKNSSNGKKILFPRFFESLDESLKLSSWIIQSYCHQILKFLNILSLQISSEDYETWITVGRQFFGPSDKVSVICIIETRNTSISTRLYIVELRYTVEIKLKNYVSSFITVDANSCCC